MKAFVYFLAVLWAIVCLPLALPIFYIRESYNLAEIFSSYIEEILKKYS